MSLEVRVADGRDLAEIDALLARSYPRQLKQDYPPSVLVTALPLISRAQPGLLSSGSYYVAVLDEAIVGAGGWTIDRRDRRAGHVRHVVTDDRLLRMGIGRAILTEVFTRARAQGVGRLICFSTRTAEPFYAALGFQSLGPMETELRPGIVFPAIRMQLDLP